MTSSFLFHFLNYSSLFLEKFPLWLFVLVTYKETRSTTWSQMTRASPLSLYSTKRHIMSHCSVAVLGAESFSVCTSSQSPRRWIEAFAVSFWCSVLLSLPWINVCLFFLCYISWTKQLAMKLKCTLGVNVKSNDRVSVQKVALKRAYTIW